MSSKVVGWVLEHSPLTGAALLVHIALADGANDDMGHEVWYRQASLAVKARTTRQTVNRTINDLLGRGLLVLVGETPGGVNRYRCLMPAGCPSIGIAGPGPVKRSTAPTRRTSTFPPMPPPPLLSRAATRQAVALKDDPVASCDGDLSLAVQSTTQIATHNLKEPKHEPKETSPPVKPGKGSRSTGRRYTDAAEALARAEWERREIKPAIGYVGFRAGIDAALAAGHSSEAVARVLPEMSNFSPNAFDFVLGTARIGRRGLRSVPLPISADRDAPEGLVQT